jgi:hypothetical protein
VRSRRDVIALVALLAALAAIALIARPPDDHQDDPRASSYLNGPDGARALFLVLDELDVQAGRLLRPWSAAMPHDVVIVLAPSVPAAPHEVDALLDWVDDGGTLVYAFRFAADPVRQALGLALQRTMPAGLDRTRQAQWAGVAAVPAVAGDGPSAAADTDTPPHAGPAAWVRGIGAVPAVRTAFRADSEALDTAAVVLLQTHEGEPVVVVLERGAGRVVAWSDADVLRNAALGEGSAALLFTRAVHAAAGDGGRAAFDEYHHGFRDGSPIRALRGFLAGTSAGRFLLQALAAGLLLLVLFGHRLGAPLAEVAGRRRSPLEHVDALAAVYRRAGARRTARRLIVAGLERRLGRRVLVADEDRVDGSIEQWTAGRRLVRAWDDGGLVELAAAADDFEVEVRRWQ